MSTDVEMPLQQSAIKIHDRVSVLRRFPLVELGQFPELFAVREGDNQQKTGMKRKQAEVVFFCIHE